MTGIPKAFTEYLTRSWRAQPENSLGGWCVTLAEDPRTPAEGALPIAMFISEDLATHIANVHNRSLEEPTTAPPSIGQQRRSETDTAVTEER